MRLGRFIVETHCHAQRIAARMSDDDVDYQRLADKMMTSVPADEADEDDEVVLYDNSDRLLYDMDAYDVDMCVLQPGAWFENRLNQKIMETNPEKFVSAASAVRAVRRSSTGSPPRNSATARATPPTSNAMGRRTNQTMPVTVRTRL